MRRLLALTALAGLCLAGLVQPAAGQQGPYITVDPSQAPAGPSSENWSLLVRGFNFTSTAPVTIAFAGNALRTVTPSGGTFSATITPSKRNAGFYQVTATQNPCGLSRSPCFFTVETTFRAVPLSSFNNPCGTTGEKVTLTVTGSFFPPESYGYVFYDPDGPDQQSRQRIPTGTGSFTASFSVVIPNRTITIQVYDVNQNQAPDLTWRPGPCPTTSTSTSTTNTTERPTTPGSDPATTTSTTLEVVDPPGPTVTVPPTVELPPETPGATLTVSPELGPPGFVTGAAGTGFPPGPVELSWEPGIGRTTTVVGPDGRFSVRVLVLPNDRLGSRALVATAGATTAFDTFLVVPSTVQPSGQDVAHINRIRRFNSR